MAQFDKHRLPHDPRRRTLSVRQARVLVGVSRRTLYNWLIQGRVEFCRTAGGKVRVFEDSLWQKGAPDAVAS